MHYPPPSSPLLPFPCPLYPSIYPFPVPVSFAPPIVFFPIFRDYRECARYAKFKQAQLDRLENTAKLLFPREIISFRGEGRRRRGVWREILRKWDDERGKKTLISIRDPPLISVSKIAMITFFSKFPYKSQ